jgi:hypothetical protein
MSTDDSTLSTTDAPSIKDLVDQASKLHDQIKALNDLHKFVYRAADYYFYLFTGRCEDATLDTNFSMFTSFLFDHQIEAREQAESLLKALKRIA